MSELLQVHCRFSHVIEMLLFSPRGCYPYSQGFAYFSARMSTNSASSFTPKASQHKSLLYLSRTLRLSSSPCFIESLWPPNMAIQLTCFITVLLTWANPGFEQDDSVNTIARKLSKFRRLKHASAEIPDMTSQHPQRSSMKQHVTRYL